MPTADLVPRPLARNPSSEGTLGPTLVAGLLVTGVVAVGTLGYIWWRRTHATAGEKIDARQEKGAQAQGKWTTVDGKQVFVPYQIVALRGRISGEQIRLWGNDAVEFGGDEIVVRVGYDTEIADDEDNTYLVRVTMQQGVYGLEVRRNGEPMRYQGNRTLAPLGDTVELARAVAVGRPFSLADEDFRFSFTPLALE